MLESFSAYDLQRRDIPPIRWIINGLIPQGLTILAGAPKAGKSWLALDLCLSVARSDPFWGRDTTPMPGSVIYLALEDSDRRLKSRMQKVLDGRDAPTNLHFITEAPPLNGGLVEQMQQLFDWKPDTSFVVIDTLGRIRQASKLDGYQKDYGELSALKRLADAQNCGIVVVHHLRKMQGSDPFDRISGTNGIMGSADTAMVLTRERKESEGRLNITGRDLDEAELVLKFSDSCRWELLSDDAKGYDFMGDPLVKYISQLDYYQGFAEEIAADYKAFCQKEGLSHGLSDTKPSISLSRRLNAISGDLWRCRKQISSTHTSKGSLITISSM